MSKLKRVEQALAKASRLAGQGKAAEADRICRQIVATLPRLAAGQFVAGEIAEARKDLEAAAECYRRATELQPGYFEAWLNLGACLRDLGECDGAIAAYEQAIRIDPRSVQAYNNIASAHVTAEQFDKAIENFHRALALRPDSAEIRHSLASLYLRIRDYIRAAEFARSAIDIDAGNARSWGVLADCQLVAGQFEEAEASFTRALEIDPAFGEAHAGLSIMKRAPEVERESLAVVEALLASPPQETAKRVGLHFAAARLYERHGNFDAAFRHYQAGNSLRAEESGPRREDVEEMFDAIIATFTRQFFAASPLTASTSDKPIFIVGMPRSGTTLTEQIVASHPQVAAAGELPKLHQLLKPGRIGSGGYAVPDAGQARSIIDQYLSALTEGRGDAGRITDKLPFNFLHLGMIHLLFPQATIIHCRRDPMDTCLSCFCQNFASDLGFTYSLEDLGRYYRHYDRLMRHWQEVLPHPILHVDYERVTAEPEAAIREIIAHCGLPWDDACLQPHETMRDVKTASLWQVRQPIYRSSVAKWRAFEANLGALKDALGDLVAASDRVAAVAE